MTTFILRPEYEGATSTLAKERRDQLAYCLNTEIRLAIPILVSYRITQRVFESWTAPQHPQQNPVRVSRSPRNSFMNSPSSRIRQHK